VLTGKVGKVKVQVPVVRNASPRLARQAGRRQNDFLVAKQPAVVAVPKPTQSDHGGLAIIEPQKQSLRICRNPRRLRNRMQAHGSPFHNNNAQVPQC
jgi:hypothetical protein